MLKNTFIIILLAAGCSLSAQYCGASGGFHCSNLDSSALPGYNPSSVYLPPFTNNLLGSATIQFTNFDSIYFGSELLYVYSTVIDSINNLPAGLCWTTDQDSNKYNPGQPGCVKIEGIPCDYTGQYKVPTILTLQISGGVSVVTDGDAGGMAYFIRLNNPGDIEIPVDTTQTDSMPILYYGGICIGLDTLQINMDTGQTVCNGSYIYLNPVVTGGQPPYLYSWHSTGSALNCDTCPFAQSILTTNSTFILAVTDFNGDVVYDTAYYSVSGQLYNFNINAEGPLNYCHSGSVVLASHPNIASAYQWFSNNNDIPGAVDSLYTAVDSSGQYFLQFTLPSCQAFSNIINLSFFSTTPAIISVPGGTNLCIGDVVILAADSSTGLSYEWIYNGNTIQSYDAVDSVTQPGTYQLAITNSLQCQDTSTAITVTSNANVATQVTFDTYSGDTLCLPQGPFSLVGGYPAGGNYYGTGISGNIFYPDSVTMGANIITYTYTDSNNCSSRASDTLIVEDCTGIYNISNNSFLSLYPNPASGLVNIFFDGLTAKYIITIFDMSGRSLPVSSAYMNGRIVVDASGFQPGVYYIELAVEGKIIRGTFIKMQ